MDDAGIRDDRVVCESSDGLQITGCIVRLSRHEVVFEVYTPAAILQKSQAFKDFKILLKEQTAYSGRAVIKNVVHTGAKVVCEAALDDDLQLSFSGTRIRRGEMQALFKEHLREWHKACRVRPEYKLLLADMESFFAELRLWLDQVELGLRSENERQNEEQLNAIAVELGEAVLPSIDALFERFEHLADELEPSARAVHRAYLQRRLHPLLLCAPFLHRTFTKPLGYAGDYEMVNMIARNRPEGGSLYAKVVNLCFVRQKPAAAHRNRLKHLTRRLVEETARMASQRQSARILSVACGPAVEIQDFLRDHEASNLTEITLLDFNDETLQHVSAAFEALKAKHSRRTPVQFVQRSVHQLLKDAARSGRPATQQFDFVYCAGLFDYMTDAVCQRLIALLYDWVTPGGLLLTTNVDATLNELCSFRHSLDFLLDWDLTYRQSSQFSGLVPESIGADHTVRSDETGVNLFLEIRKPSHG